MERGEEVQYCGEAVEKSCIKLMFGSTGAEEFLPAAAAAAAAVQSLCKQTSSGTISACRPDY